MMSPHGTWPALVAADVVLPPVVAEALAAELADVVVGRWPGGAVWLPCGHPSAVGHNRFNLDPGVRPDLPYELEVQLAPGALAARGTFLPVGVPGEVPVPVRCVFTLPEPGPLAGHVVEVGHDGTICSGTEALADLIEFELSRPGRMAVVSDALDLQVFFAMSSFFEQVHEQPLSRDRLRFEARMWRQLVLCRWPLTSPEARRILAALNLLAAVPVEAAVADPGPLAPGNELQHVLARLRHDPGARPRLWEALYRSTVHLAVPAYEIEPGHRVELALLGAKVQGVRHVFGFTSADGLAGVLAGAGAGAPMVTVEVTGDELRRFWPSDQWLVLDPGTSLATVLEPAEVRFLPHGPHHGVPHPDSVHVLPLDPDPVRDQQLADVAAHVDAVDALSVAALVDKAGGSAQAVLAVAVSDPTRLAGTLAVLGNAVASAGVGGFLVVPVVDDNPLAGLLRRHGRVVYRRSAGRRGLR
jgi:hypothetical protein